MGISMQGRAFQDSAFLLLVAALRTAANAIETDCNAIC
jgi:hypothetical protein